MQLSPPAQRVLGCLVEKSLATPQQYPLTRNSLRTACNQTTGRDPVVAYDDNTVEDALHELREPALVRTEVVKGSRTPKYSHRLEEQLDLAPAEQAIVALLLLRGPQTEGELRTRSERMYAFGSLEEVDDTLAQLATRDLVERLPRSPGEKAERWAHRLGRSDDAPGAATAADHTEHHPGTPGTDGSAATELERLQARVEELERQVTELRARLDAAERSTGPNPP